jgi:phosphatidylglycerophosphate synthase
MINDNVIMNHLKFLLPLFKNIHPNYITILGTYLNFKIFHLVSNNKIKEANILLVIRFLCDIFDGAVARHFKKSSKIGGLLDTISDNILFTMYVYIICFYFTKNKNLSYGAALTSLVININYLIKLDGVYDHSKSLNSSQSNQVHTFFSNNTWIYFITIISFNNYFLKK